jgi:hypothetical protein
MARMFSTRTLWVRTRCVTSSGIITIDIDVEFGRRGDVAALEKAAAHHHQLAYPGRDLRRLGERQRNVGERPERRERHRARRLGAHRLDDEIDGVLVLKRHRRFVENGAVEAGLAVDMLGGDERARDRPVRTGEDLHVCPVAELADDPGVARRQRERNVAGNGGDAEDVDLLRAAEGEHDRGRVVLSRIRVDDDLSRF